MQLLIHPKLPLAVIVTNPLKSSALMHLWDLNLMEAQKLHTIELPHQIQEINGNDQEIGVIYTQGEPTALDVPMFLMLRRWDDIQNTKTIRLSFGPTSLQSLAFSPDNEWIAIASFEEQLCLFDHIHEQSIALIEGGKFISGCTFSPDSHLLAAAHTFQGGGCVSIYRTQNGEVDQFHEELDRSSLVSPIGDFADTFTRMSFSPDGQLLAIFETKKIRGSSWYGDILLYEILTGKPRWLVPLHHPRTKRGSKKLFLTDVRFEPNGQTILVGSPWGTVQRFATADASLLGEYSFGSNKPITTFGVEQTHHRLWILDQADTLKSCNLL